MSWFQLLDVMKQAQQEFDFYANRPPMSCPRCGEPLIPTPRVADNALFCRYDGWSFPADWVRPERS